MIYKTNVTFFTVTSEGSYDEDRVWQAPAEETREVLWSGKLALEDAPELMRYSDAGNRTRDFDASAFARKQQRETLMSLLDDREDVYCETPLGVGKVVGLRHLDGEIRLNYLRE